MNICIYGASSEDLDKIYYDEAYNLGEYISSLGHGIIFGGGNYGLMGSIARGVSKNKGYILGIAPKFFDKDDILYKSCTEFIYPPDMRTRKYLMEDKADAFIALPGGIGTYEELLETMTLKQLGRINKPIAIYNINNYYDPFLKMMDETIDKGFMKSAARKIFNVYSDKETMLKNIELELKNPLVLANLKNI